MKKLLFNLLLLIMVSIGAVAQETLTVNDGTGTNSYVPVYGLYTDTEGTNSEFLVLSSTEGMSDMIGKSITSMKFFLSSSAGAAWTATFKVYIKEVEDATLSTVGGPDGGNVVYTGNLDATGSEMTVTFDNEYLYNGGNLLVGFYVQTAGNWKSAAFYGAETTDNMSAYSYVYGGSAYAFSPKTTFSYELPTSCPKPTDMTASNITSSTAEIEWIAGGSETEWNLKWGAAGFDVENEGTLVEHLSAASYSLTGLTANTEYDAYVKAVCSESEESAWRSFSFRTECGVQSIPYTETFETEIASNAIPYCWERIVSYDSYGTTYPYVYDYSAHAGSNCMYMYTAGSSNPENVIAMPLMDNINTLRVKLWAKAGSTIPEAFEVGYVKEGVFTSLSSFTLTTSYQQYVAYLNNAPADAERIAIRSYHSSSYAYAYFDDIEVSLIPSCLPPSGLAVSEITARAATIAWVAGADETAWQISLQDDEDDLIDVTDNTYTFTDLSPESDYTVKVRANCGEGDFSEWTLNVSFETLPSCLVPTDLTVSDITAHSAVATWTAGAGETEWQVSLNGDVDDIITVTEPTYTIIDLSPESDYTVAVRANCGGIDGVSAWTSAMSFTTTITCPAPSSFEMVSYTTTSATLSWFAGEALSWVLQYGEDSNFAEGAYTEVDLDASTYEITGLTAETIYYARVKANCSGDEESEWSSVLSFEPTAKVVIGSGANSSSSLPTNSLYNNTLSQQIYTAEEIGQAGYISSIDFYNSGTEKTRTLDVYIVRTNKTSFESATDWITVTADDLVYSGSLTFASGSWKTIEFNTDFYYDGINNLAVIVDDNTGSWSSGLSCTVFDAPSQAIKVSADGTDYNPTDPSSYTGTVMEVKNQIRLLVTPGEPPSCVKPTALAVSDINMTGANLSWTAGADETAWQICIGEDEENLIDVTEPTYTMTELTAATTYSVKVRSNCGEGEYSDWTYPIEFTTPFCAAEDQCQISFELTDGYGDGWNGAEIVVTDVATGIVIATIANQNLDGYTNTEETNTLTLDVCDGRDLQFSWVAGSYDDECSYTITDVNGDEIFSGEDAMSSPVDYNVSCSTCRKPSELQVSNITISSATLGWTAGADETAWQICINEDEDNLIDVDANTYEMTGLDELTNYTVKVRAYCSAEEQSSWISTTFTTLSSCPAPVNLAADVASFSANISWEADADSYIVRYRNLIPVEEEGFENGIPETWTTIDADADGHNWLTISEVPTTYSYYADVDLSEWAHAGSNSALSPSYVNDVGSLTSDQWLISPQIELGALLTFYITSSYYDEYEVLLSTTGTEVSDFVTTLKPMGASSSDWEAVAVDLSSYSGQQGYIAIHHVFEDGYFLIVDDFGIYTYGDWVEVESTDTSAVLSNLTASTTYQYQVASVCGSDDDNWSEIGSFTTLVSCPVPTALAANNITPRTATLAWTAGADETAWQVMINDNEEDIVDVEDTPTYEITNLTPETTYSVKVRAYCDVDDQSEWVSVDFTTGISCAAPTALTATLTPGNGTIATLSWTENGTATAWTIEYGTESNFTGATSVEVSETPSINLTGLTAETTYYARVKTICDVDDESSWSTEISFTPTDAYSITLNDGTETNSYVPVYGLYVDDYSRSQFIIPAADLASLQGATITKLTYYSSNASVTWDGAEFDVRLAEVDNTTIESLATWDDMALAYQGSLGIRDNLMEITFTTPYTYMGGNLMIGTNETTSGSYSSCSWYGVTATGASLGGYGTSISQKNFLPKVTITYTPGAPIYTITASAGENGTITPSGDVLVSEGNDQAFTIEPAEGYRIISVLVDGTEAVNDLVNNVYTFTNVTANHTITASFVDESTVTYTITATAGEHGTITPSGAISVAEGANQAFTITPDEGYKIDIVNVDGNDITLSEEQMSGYVYEFTAVSATHTISATFTSLNASEMIEAASMSIYPNPNNGMFSIDFSGIEGDATYELIDARGAIIETQEINVTDGETKNFNHKLTAGTYFVRIISGDKVYVEQIVVE